MYVALCFTLLLTIIVHLDCWFSFRWHDFTQNYTYMTGICLEHVDMYTVVIQYIEQLRFGIVYTQIQIIQQVVVALM